jgi:RHS repeat-associated protein
MRLIQEHTTRNSATTVSYTRGNDLSGSLEKAGGIGGLLARSSGYSSGNWTSHNYYFADGNGNVTYMLNSSQSMVASYRYDPFGNTISSSGTLASTNVYRFSSKEIHVNSGMYYYLYRFYDPNLQRWINRDPILESGFETIRNDHLIRALCSKVHRESLEGPNLYSFVSNEPNSHIDKYGLMRVNACPSEAVVICGLGCAAKGAWGYCYIEIYAIGEEIYVRFVCQCIPWRSRPVEPTQPL